MKTLHDLHKENFSIKLDVEFHMHEMEFYKKLIAEKEQKYKDRKWMIEGMRAYKSSFSDIIDQMNELKAKVQQEEKKLSTIAHQSVFNLNEMPVEEHSNDQKVLKNMIERIRLFRESLYDFLASHKFA